jgi:outer membrane protein OmpA-like peptidoglycan-associated protein
MVSVFHLFRQRLMLPLQIFLGVFILGVWNSVPNIERNLTERATEIVKSMGLQDRVRVSFFGPVATVSGKVTDAETKQQLIDRISSMVSVWGLHVENQQTLVVVPPPLPVTYRLDFANRQIKVSGSVPGLLERKSLLRKVATLFPKAAVSGEDEIVLQNQAGSEETVAGIWLNPLERLPDLEKLGQFRWVVVEEGRLIVSANLPSKEAESAFTKGVRQINPQAHVEDLKIIALPNLELLFASNNQITIKGKLAAAAEQVVVVEALQSLFSSRTKVTTECEFDEKVGPAEWILPQLLPLRALQKLGKLTRVVLDGPMPLIEAEALNVSAQISLNSAIEEAYQKNVKATITLFTPVVNTITPPSVWVKIGEDAWEVTGKVVDENGRKLLLTKLATIFPSMKFKEDITIVPKLAPTALYASALDPMVDIPNLEPSLILQSFGLVDGRLRFVGLVPETAAKDRLTGTILKRHSGKVGADITVDPSYLPAPDASWTAKFAAGKIVVEGQFSSRQLKSELTTNLEETFPGWTIENQAEVLPSGLRRGAWAPLLAGIAVVAAPPQITQLFWQHGSLGLSARVVDERAQAAMEKRLLHTYGNAIKGQFELVDEPALRNDAAVELVDCTIYFSAAQRDFIALELPKIQRVLDVLVAHPEINIVIEGHTDNKGSATVNLNLSQSRAESVRKWFLRRQIDPARITAKGYGQRRPVADFKTEAGRAASRRLEFRVR